MYCAGGHLEFSIGIKNKHFVEDLPMVIHGQFDFNCPSGFKNASSLKPLGQLKPNCPGMIIGGPLQSICFDADRKFKMATTAIHILTFLP
jgi:hypothetical protein